MIQTKQLYTIALAAYLLFLLWLVLFKLSADPFSVLAHYQSRSLNLIPLAGHSMGTLREIADNFIVFIPFGLLLSIACKHLGLWRKLAYIGAFSAAAEITQFVFAIGTTDITDVLSNTLGGLFGLLAYSAVARYVDTQKLDQFIVITLALLVTAFIMLRFMVLKVRY